MYCSYLDIHSLSFPRVPAHVCSLTHGDTEILAAHAIDPESDILTSLIESDLK